MPEQKSILSDIANSFIQLFNVDRFREITGHFVMEEYDRGALQVEREFDFNVDFRATAIDKSMLEQYTLDNIKGMTTEMQNRIRQEIQRGLMAGENPKQLRERVSGIFRGDDPNRFRFEDRIRTIIRTESKRALNMARYNNVKRLNMPMKKWLITRDDMRTSNICLEEGRKYGSPDKAIDIDEMFEVTVNGKTYIEQYPPFHPNCRTEVVFIQPEEDKQ